MGTKLRDAMFREAMSSAFGKLRPEDQVQVDEMVTTMCSKINNMGPQTAMEAIAKMGLFSSGQLKQLSELLETIDKQERQSRAEEMECRQDYLTSQRPQLAMAR